MKTTYNYKRTPRKELPTSPLYVAYGSNMNVNQMAYRCPDSKLIGTGTIKDYELVFNFHADIRKKNGASVPVTIWSIGSRDDWMSLDMYEGLPRYYDRITVDVELDNGKTVKATVYVMVNERAEGIAVPSREYFNGIEEGYKSAGIDPQPLYNALSETYRKLFTNED